MKSRRLKKPELFHLFFNILYSISQMVSTLNASRPLLEMYLNVRTLVSKHMLWDWDWYHAEFTQRVFYARIFRLCYYYHKLCIVTVTIVKCCETYMLYDWSKRTYFAYSTALIQIKKEPLQYKMKWCRIKKVCKFLSFTDELNRENNKLINK